MFLMVTLPQWIQCTNLNVEVTVNPWVLNTIDVDLK